MVYTNKNSISHHYSLLSDVYLESTIPISKSTQYEATKNYQILLDFLLLTYKKSIIDRFAIETKTELLSISILSSVDRFCPRNHFTFEKHRATKKTKTSKIFETPKRYQ